MSTNEPLTIISSRSFAGTFPSVSSNNVAWNEDGQCSFLTRRAVNIVTPHLATSLPPPPNLAGSSSRSGPSANGGGPSGRSAQSGALGDDDDDDDGGGLADADMVDGAVGAGGMEVDLNKSLGKRTIRRPSGGEVIWWSTAVEIDKEGMREDHYGWGEVGEESTAIITEREVTARQAVWSPSGLSDLGSCLLVILTSYMQVSVYAPRSDPYAKQWDEIADITTLSKGLLSQEELDEGLTERGMMELRTMCLQWSSSIPLARMIGIDGSLLAISNRIGQLALWNYGPERRFKRVALVDLNIPGGWVSEMAWSDWQVVHDDICEAQLALALTDGSVTVLPIQQRALRDNAGRQTWELELGSEGTVHPRDKRAIGTLRWVKDVLVWTKPGAVTLYALQGCTAVQWNGARSVKLERVGNWAGANALTPCVGIHLINRDTLLIVLSSLTAHLITSFTTNPTLAPPLKSLGAALAFRQTFLDQLYSDPMIKMRWRTLPLEDQGWTAYTQGWASAGWGTVAAWVTEPLNFHNLDAVTEGKRSMNFTVANLGSAAPQSDLSAIESLTKILSNPPSLLQTAPGRVLMPYLLHIVGSSDPQSHAEAVLSLVQPSQTDDGEDGDTLLESLWGQPSLDALRIRYVLASWGATAFPSSITAFQAVASSLSTSINQLVLHQLVRSVERVLLSDGSETLHLGSIDGQFIAQLVKAVNAIPSEARSPRLHSSLQALLAAQGKYTEQNSVPDGSSSYQALPDERCPACGMGVDAEGKCERGHAWSRCSITHLLITHPRYRVCSTCPAISLLPTRHESAPITVDPDGSDRDWQRFRKDPATVESGAEEDGVVQQVLEAAICCLLCGGRWMRAV